MRCIQCGTIPRLYAAIPEKSPIYSQRSLPTHYVTADFLSALKSYLDHVKGLLH